MHAVHIVEAAPCGLLQAIAHGLQNNDDEPAGDEEVDGGCGGREGGGHLASIRGDVVAMLRPHMCHSDGTMAGTLSVTPDQLICVAEHVNIWWCRPCGSGVTNTEADNNAYLDYVVCNGDAQIWSDTKLLRELLPIALHHVCLRYWTIPTRHLLLRDNSIATNVPVLLLMPADSRAGGGTFVNLLENTAPGSGTKTWAAVTVQHEESVAFMAWIAAGYPIPGRPLPEREVPVGVGAQVTPEHGGRQPPTSTPLPITRRHSTRTLSSSFGDAAPSPAGAAGGATHLAATSPVVGHSNKRAASPSVGQYDSPQNAGGRRGRRNRRRR
jgi:hypothetical protein